MDAAIELMQDNFGIAVGSLGIALDLELNSSRVPYFDSLMRVLRLFERRGYGERLIAWFPEASRAERLEPLYAAFVAYVRGEQFLLDVNPEVRQVAATFYAWLATGYPARETSPPKRRRGRPPRRRVATS